MMSTADGSIYNSYEMADLEIGSIVAEESTLHVGGQVLSQPVLFTVGAFYSAILQEFQIDTFTGQKVLGLQLVDTSMKLQLSDLQDEIHLISL